MNFFTRYLNNYNPRPQIDSVAAVRSCSRLFNATILTVGGGKGGVGKSMVAANIGVLLSKTGKKALIVDADLGAANLHTFLGTTGNARPFSSYLKGEISDIRNVISRTQVPNLDLIGGSRDALDVVNIGVGSASRLKEAFKSLEYDYILLDIGPGTASKELDFFMMADEGILVLTPEPTSLDNTYRFLKCLIFRKLNKVADVHGDEGLKKLIRTGFDENGTGTIMDVFERFKKANFRQGSILESVKNNIKVSIVINQARKPEDKTVGPFIKRACYDYFGIDLRYLGHIEFDESVPDSVRTRQPLTIKHGESMASRDIERCFHRLMVQETRSTGSAV